MSNEQTPGGRSRGRRPLHEVVYLWGVGILVGGLASAALIYAFAGDDREAEAALEMRGRMYEHNLEVIGGKLNVYLAQFNDWFASLWHGTALAFTVAVLSAVIALGCFWVAHLIATAPPEDSDQGRQH